MQPGPDYLSNRYAVLEEDLPGLSGEKERNSSAEISTQQQCCQQLSSMIMELFSKEAILTSQSLALLLDKINAIDVKNKTLTLEKPTLDVLPFNKKQELSSYLGPSSQDCNKRREIKVGSTPKLTSKDIKRTEKLTQDGMNKTHSLLASHDPNPHIRPRDEHLEAEEPHRQMPINCQEGAIYETELDLRSHQVISMPSGAPIKVKSLALELREAEAEQARTQQCQLIPMDRMSKEAEGKLILPITSVKGAQVPHHKAKTSADIQVHQDDEGAPLGLFHQEEMLDNSIEESFLPCLQILHFKSNRL
ncbi:UNVERIFIED_CONTAM: hypothetical protein K2H54_040109 [Gekko kuhli]